MYFPDQKSIIIIGNSKICTCQASRQYPPLLSSPSRIHPGQGLLIGSHHWSWLTLSAKEPSEGDWESWVRKESIQCLKSWLFSLALSAVIRTCKTGSVHLYCTVSSSAPLPPPLSSSGHWNKIFLRFFKIVGQNILYNLSRCQCVFVCVMILGNMSKKVAQFVTLDFLLTQTPLPSNAIIKIGHFCIVPV